MRQYLIPLFLAILPLAVGCSSQTQAPHYTTRVSPIDGKTMVRVPAGEFAMGTTVDQARTLADQFDVPTEYFNSESPSQKMTLPEFYIDQTTVTNEEYAKFLKANPSRPVPFADDILARSANWDQANRTYPAQRDLYPVVLVSWEDASAYCRWAGKRLPTEAEWEKAARGTDGRLWPWGNEWDTNKANSVEQQNDAAVATGQFPGGASPSGALDMVGNVWQWTSSLDKPYPYDAADGREDPGASGLRVTRGGAWAFGPYVTRAATRNRFDPNDASLSIGFRCAQSN
jgi:formylglycine-generating enzyme required for sulfatase activity